MPMLLIKGTYKVIGARPDGDSVRFYPDDPHQWDLLRGRRVRRNKSGGAQLRLDGIDALETHYRPRGGPELHQPAPFAQHAADETLTWLHFKNVRRDEEGTVKEATPAEVRGYVLTRTADVYGRCVALAGRGETPGTWIKVDVPLLKKTLNHHQLRQGLAYPTFYRMLYVDLREEMAEAAKAARTAGKGLWPKDETESGAKLDGLETLTDSSVLMPKLFRRLADYLVLGDGDPSLAGFPDYLEQRDDRLFVLANGQSTGFDTVVDVTNGRTVRMNQPPEGIVFEEK
jgi:endonuclease YncB( thermonuclease family)